MEPAKIAQKLIVLIMMLVQNEEFVIFDIEVKHFMINEQLHEQTKILAEQFALLPSNFDNTQFWYWVIVYLCAR